MKPWVKNNQLKRALWITRFKLQAIQESFPAHHFVGFSHDFFSLMSKIIHGEFNSILILLGTKVMVSFKPVWTGCNSSK